MSLMNICCSDALRKVLEYTLISRTSEVSFILHYNYLLEVMLNQEVQ